MSAVAFITGLVVGIPLGAWLSRFTPKEPPYPPGA